MPSEFVKIRDKIEDFFGREASEVSAEAKVVLTAMQPILSELESFVKTEGVAAFQDLLKSALTTIEADATGGISIATALKDVAGAVTTTAKADLTADEASAKTEATQLSSEALSAVTASVKLDPTVATPAAS